MKKRQEKYVLITHYNPAHTYIDIRSANISTKLHIYAFIVFRAGQQKNAHCETNKPNLVSLLACE